MSHQPIDTTPIGEISLRCYEPMSSPEFQFFMTVDARDGQRFVAEPVVFRPSEPNRFADPFLRIPRFPIQTGESKNPLVRLMDDLWAMGVRPTDAGSKSGEVEAMKGHLEDLRTLLMTSDLRRDGA